MLNYNNKIGNYLNIRTCTTYVNLSGGNEFIKALNSPHARLILKTAIGRFSFQYYRTTLNMLTISYPNFYIFSYYRKNGLVVKFLDI